MAMSNSSRHFSLPEKMNTKMPGRLSIYIVLQYANSLRVEKKLPNHLNSFIIN